MKKPYVDISGRWQLVEPHHKSKLIRVLEWTAIVGILVATALTGLNVYPLNVIVSVTSELIYVISAVLERRTPMIVLNLGMITLLVVGVIVKHV